jgi:hypothetical protein
LLLFINSGRDHIADFFHDGSPFEKKAVHDTLTGDSSALWRFVLNTVSVSSGKLPFYIRSFLLHTVSVSGIVSDIAPYPFVT